MCMWQTKIYTRTTKLSVEHFNNVNFFLRIYFCVFLLFFFFIIFGASTFCFFIFCLLCGNEFDFFIHRFSFRCFAWHTKVKMEKTEKMEKSKRISHLYRTYYYNHYIFTICCDAFWYLFRFLPRCLLHRCLQQPPPPFG